jgi:hypothetical protein
VKPAGTAVRSIQESVPERKYPMSPHEPTAGPQQEQPTRPLRQPRKHDGLSLSQLVASALAAASAAFGASFLGVAGTIIGAAVASVIATVASAMYSSSLQRTTEVVQGTVTQWTRTAATAPVVDPAAPEPPDHARRPVPWGRVAVAAVAVLVVTLGALTGIEGILGRPIASVVGGSHATGTSLGSATGAGGSPARHPSTPSPSTPAATPSGPATPSPSATPTDEPSVPAPTTPVPVPTPSADPVPSVDPSPAG